MNTLPQKNRIYLLKSDSFTPEVIAVAFAKTSRSPQSFDKTASELTEHDSSRFHEQWVVGYGHASVAEHAVLHVACEGISRLACEMVESSRLASYTEKSSRYQVFASHNYYIPEVIQDSSFSELYRKTIEELFSFYHDSMGAIREITESWYPRRENENEKAYEGRIRSRYIDNLRYLIPAAALTNVGMTINARSLEYTISKLLSHPLKEVRQIGLAMKDAAIQEVPTLVKYAKPNECMEKMYYQYSSFDIPDKPPKITSVSIVDPINEDDAENKLALGILSRYSQASVSSIESYLANLTRSERLEIIHKAFNELGQYDNPIKELEHLSFTFESVLDQGAYYDIKRHRMMTQSVQDLGVGLGYTLPLIYEEAGLASHYHQCMERVGLAYEEIQTKFPYEASYIVPNAFRRRFYFTINLRELFVLCRLRTGRNGHFAYRRFAVMLLEAIKEKYPFLDALLPAIEESSGVLSANHFAKGYA